MRDRLVDNLDYFQLRLRAFRINIFDSQQRPQDRAGRGQQKAHQAKQRQDMTDTARRFPRSVSQRHRAADFASASTEYSSWPIIDLHWAILNAVG